MTLRVNADVYGTEYIYVYKTTTPAMPPFLPLAAHQSCPRLTRCAHLPQTRTRTCGAARATSSQQARPSGIGSAIPTLCWLARSSGQSLRVLMPNLPAQARLRTQSGPCVGPRAPGTRPGFSSGPARRTVARFVTISTRLRHRDLFSLPSAAHDGQKRPKECP